MRVLGKDITEYEVETLSKEINILGSYWQAAGVKKLAIYLANDLEYLLSIFGRFCRDYRDLAYMQ